ncbi:6,7-dimethyl-8-ribityllumazine synthase [Desulfosarcina sp. OttesenSCG-928-A07]|nr:6,7-dimethyl-8-ribityllumazine synthase [Desulfosarcina sp. OttesenSCG-928-G17]MDL2330058.1 6,7-dimethyl-8-ribityllumazine synthase [Desulfosarcina sp. OttesenSCG-928-A07]
MPNLIEAGLIGKGKRFAIIASRFNDFITDRLVGGALDALTRSGVDDGDIDLIKVPGAYEIPLVAQRVAESKKYHAVICLGAVIRGATPHFDYVCAEAAKGIAQAAMAASLPVMFGILTTDTIEQAIERAGTKAGNKGWDTAVAAIEMANLMERV